MDREEPDTRYTRAIVHFDGDSFFASVEQALDYRLRGRPVVTGGERGAATSLSIEAKRRGLTRGISMREIRRLVPDAVIIPGNYTAYSIFAERMYAIVRRHTPFVEEYSIDECFADITGLAEPLGISYEELALRIKVALETALGVTFGVGLAPSKTLAKVASKLRKPAGFKPIPNKEIPDFLRDMPIHDIWGLGGSSSMQLKKIGIETALDLVAKSRDWILEHKLAKPVRETWLELSGYSVRALHTEHGGKPGSIMHTRTFSPPSTREAFIASQLSKNLEAACRKLRTHRARAKGASFFLKTQEFTYHSVQFTFHIPLNNPSEILEFFFTRFHEVYAEGILYRATGVTLYGLVPYHADMPNLFADPDSSRKDDAAIKCVDSINRKWGNHSIFLGSTLLALGVRASPVLNLAIPVSRRPGFLLAGDSLKKSLNIPFLGVVR